MGVALLGCGVRGAAPAAQTRVFAWVGLCNTPHALLHGMSLGRTPLPWQNAGVARRFLALPPEEQERRMAQLRQQGSTSDV